MGKEGKGTESRWAQEALCTGGQVLLLPGSGFTSSSSPFPTTLCAPEALNIRPCAHPEGNAGPRLLAAIPQALGQCSQHRHITTYATTLKTQLIMGHIIILYNVEKKCCQY